MDWYNEAKARQVERLHEADNLRLLRSAQGARQSRARSSFMSWLGGRMVASGKRLQAHNN